MSLYTKSERRPRAILGWGALALLLAVGLSGCVFSTATIFTAADVTTFIHTDKSIGDHLASLATGENCSTLNVSDGGSYCQAEKAVATAAPPAQYCYRTLANISCYDRPNPFAYSAPQSPVQAQLTNPHAFAH